VYFLNERGSLDGKKVAVRLSREDVLDGAARKVSFARADAIFFESYVLRELFLSGRPDIRSGTPLEVVIRAADTRGFAFIPRYGQKRIASVIPKSYESAEFILLLEAFLAIHRKHPETELHLSVGFRNMDLEQHVTEFLTENGIGYSVFFHGRGEDLKTFLNSCHCFLSAESYPGAPGAIEALLLGLRPVIRAGPGSRELYPDNCTWRSISDVAALYENPPDALRISRLLSEIHRPSGVIPQYVQRFIALDWF
jgi:glycosyltransferase involved in cell wall biosynthesis